MNCGQENATIPTKFDAHYPDVQRKLQPQASFQDGGITDYLSRDEPRGADAAACITDICPSVKEQNCTSEDRSISEDSSSPRPALPAEPPLVDVNLSPVVVARGLVKECPPSSCKTDTKLSPQPENIAAPISTNVDVPSRQLEDRLLANQSNELPQPNNEPSSPQSSNESQPNDELSTAHPNDEPTTNHELSSCTSNGESPSLIANNERKPPTASDNLTSFTSNGELPSLITNAEPSLPTPKDQSHRAMTSPPPGSRLEQQQSKSAPMQGFYQDLIDISPVAGHQIRSTPESPPVGSLRCRLFSANTQDPEGNPSSLNRSQLQTFPLASPVITEDQLHPLNIYHLGNAEHNEATSQLLVIPSQSRRPTEEHGFVQLRNNSLLATPPPSVDTALAGNQLNKTSPLVKVEEHNETTPQPLVQSDQPWYTSAVPTENGFAQFKNNSLVACTPSPMDTVEAGNQLHQFPRSSPLPNGASRHLNLPSPVCHPYAENEPVQLRNSPFIIAPPSLEEASQSGYNSMVTPKYHGGQSRSSATTSKDPGSASTKLSTSLPKRTRISYSAIQLGRMESVFLHTAYPDTLLYEKLETEISVPQKNLKTWFQNKRARNKKEKALEAKHPPKTAAAAPTQHTLAAQPTLPHYPYVTSIGPYVTSIGPPRPTYTTHCSFPPGQPQHKYHPSPFYLHHLQTTTGSPSCAGEVGPTVTYSAPFRTHGHNPMPRLWAPQPQTEPPQFAVHAKKEVPIKPTTKTFTRKTPAQLPPGSWQGSRSVAGNVDPVFMSPEHVSTLQALEKLCSSMPFERSFDSTFFR